MFPHISKILEAEEEEEEEVGEVEDMGGGRATMLGDFYGDNDNEDDGSDMLVVLDKT